MPESEEIKKARKYLGLTQEQLINKFGISIKEYIKHFYKEKLILNQENFISLENIKDSEIPLVKNNYEKKINEENLSFELNSSFSSINESIQKIVCKYYLEGKSVETISREENISPTSVYRKKNNAKAKLKKLSKKDSLRKFL